MKAFLGVVVCICACFNVFSQLPKGATPRESNAALPDLAKVIVAVQENASLFSQNQADKSKEHDVNTIILDIEKYIDSLPKTRTRSDALVVKYFAPLRLFFLTTTNKTTVATSFLFADAPYRFARYNDTALALHLGAVKNGDVYNLGKTTERKIAGTSMKSCLLPALKAVDEFKESEIKYIAMSIYYGATDTRDGAESHAMAPYCMTLLARLQDVLQYNAGFITAKGLLAVSEVYISDLADGHELHKAIVSAD